MTTRPASAFRWLSPLLAFLALGCGASDDESGPPELAVDNDTALSDDVDALYDGWPGNDKLPDEGKADAVYPAKFSELVALQSPVRNQASRGVCSIFSTVGLMEHLYIKEGTLTTPDFSEEFLQWTVKAELGRFTNTEGSNATANIDAIHTFGIVFEAEWPYLGRRWNTSDDPACEGDSQPTRCYTHGDPPAAALAAQRWHLPASRWISSTPNSIKAHLYTNRHAVVVGGTFYYQSWNHGKSTLPTNGSYLRKGYVTYPNAEDKTASEANRAGHSFVLVGWDDELTVQSRDKDGTLMTDAEGQPIVEKGFYLFKNSWGTSSFGVENPFGPGYGWISMRYVQDILTAAVSDVPEIEVQEICGDEQDNDYDGDVDCDDSDCASEAACQSTTTGLYTNEDGQPIPDNDPSGITSEIVVPDGGQITSLRVSVDISHSYQGDLSIKLVRDGGGEVLLRNQQGGSADDIHETYVVTDFDGEDAAGTWRLVVADHANLDTGTLNRWSLEVKTGGESNVTVYESDVDVAIPDNDATGAFSNITVDDGGALAGLRVEATIDHPYQGDLTVKLLRVGLPGEIVLQQADAASGSFGTKSYTVADYNGQDAAGTWRLWVIDEAAGDVGTLTGWHIEIAR